MPVDAPAAVGRLADEHPGALREAGIARPVARESKGAAGCAIVGIAIDTGVAEAELLEAVRGAFRAWSALLAQQLAASGMPRARGRSVALMAVAAVEGGLVLCRAEGGPGPLEAVAAELGRLVKG